MPSPFREEHDHFRRTVRQFAEKELAPYIDEWEKAEVFPNEVFKKAGDLGILGAHYSEEIGGGGGDYWFSVVKSEELPRCGGAGVVMALLVQSDMATPVIGDLGTKEQIAEFLTPALKGEKVAALGVSEPNAGSDVAGIQTVAKKDGDDYVINGAKTYITNGTRADFVTLLAKTNPDAGAHGCSFFLVPTKTKGFNVARKLKKLGNHSSRHGGALLRGHAHPEALPPRRGEPGLHVPDAELPVGAPHRLARAPAPARSSCSTSPSPSAASARRSASRS